MSEALDPKPARIGPIVEGDWLYRPMRRVMQMVVLAAMGLVIATEWLALLLRLE